MNFIPRILRRTAKLIQHNQVLMFTKINDKKFKNESIKKYVENLN